MSKPIDGPYQLLQPGEGENDSDNLEIHDPYGRIATVYGEVNEPEIQATGRLLAAAPEMLRLLRQMRAAEEAAMAEIITDYRQVLENMEKARAVIREFLKELDSDPS